jgi:hypothetical protein
MNYAVGVRVKRLEARPQVGAVVLAVEDDLEGQTLKLSYDEGGSGWWRGDLIQAES